TMPGLLGSTYAGIATVLEKEGRIEEALQAHCHAIETAPYVKSLHETLPALLRSLGPSPTVGAMLDDLGDQIEGFLDQDYPGVLQTIALARLHGEKKRNLGKAFEWIEKARTQAGGEEPGIVS